MLTVCLLVNVQGHKDQQLQKAGTHCGNFTGANHDNSGNESGIWLHKQLFSVYCK
jgi:hypothetical protein